MILVSVVIACYNYGRYLTDAVYSLIGGETGLGKVPPQTLNDFEIIIVNDASTDGTSEIARDLLWENDRIKYVEHGSNKGTPATYNTGVKWAEGEYITMLSADDMREPWSLELLLKTCQQNLHGVAYDNIRCFTNEKRGDILQLQGYSFEAEIRHNLLHAGIMYPYRAWEEVDGYEESMVDGREEWAFGIALGLKNWHGVHVERAGYLYRKEGQNRSLHNSSREQQTEFVRLLRELYPEAFARLKPMQRRGQTNRDDRILGAV